MRPSPDRLGLPGAARATPRHGGLLLLLILALAAACVSAAIAQPPAPLPASGLQAADVPNDAGRAITLTWNAVAGATSYWVTRSEGYAGCNFGKARVATVVGTSYADMDVANGQTYYYNVVAQGTSEACFGPASACVTGTPQPCAGAISMTF